MTEKNLEGGKGQDLPGGTKLKGGLMRHIAELSERNPGATRVVVELTRIAGQDVALDIMERSGLRGAKIWNVYKDVCKEDIESTFITIENVVNIEGQSETPKTPTLSSFKVAYEKLPAPLQAGGSAATKKIAIDAIVNGYRLKGN